MNVFARFKTFRLPFEFDALPGAVRTGGLGDLVVGPRGVAIEPVFVGVYGWSWFSLFASAFIDVHIYSYSALLGVLYCFQHRGDSIINIWTRLRNFKTISR